MNLFGNEEVGIDGTFIRGNASKASIHTQEQLQKQLEKLNKKIDEYIEQLEQNDNVETDITTEDVELKIKLEKLKERQATCQSRLTTLEESGEKQFSATDPDARLLNKRGTTTAGYNVQIAVDTANKLLVCTDVINDGNDTRQLAPMAVQAKETLEVDTLAASGDTGYYDKAQIKTCVDVGITPYVAIPDKEAPVREAGRFPRSMFTYDPDTNSYKCPAEQVLTRQGQQKKNGKTNHRYVSDEQACSTCEHKVQCLPEKTPYKQLYRWEHEDVIDEHKARMEETGREHMVTRASVAEHPFGTLKENMGWRSFLLRGLEKVQAEMNLLMLCYNFKRVLNIIGIGAFKIYLEQRSMAI